MYHYHSNVTGTQADVIQPPVRVHAQVAVSTLQLLLIATRGHRPYTTRELHIIFKDVGTQFYRSLEAISEWLENSRVHEATQRHLRNPDRYHAPDRFQPTTR